MKEINTKSNQFQNVLKKAIASRPLVRPVAPRIGDSVLRYLVRGSSGDFYCVAFQRSASEKMLGSCLCSGAMRGFYCYHLAAALLAHSAFVRAGLRPSAPTRQSAQVLPEIAEALRVPSFACRPQFPMFA